MLIQWRRSENYSHGRDGYDVEWVVLHYDAASDGRRNASWMIKPEAKRSPHYYIFRDGLIYNLVDPRDTAWHAGASQWWYKGKMTYGVNRFSIGIEIANLGYIYKSESGKYHYEHNGTMYPYRGPGPKHATLTYDDGQSVSGYWEPYTDHQMDSLIDLLDKLRELGYPLNVTGHESIGLPLGRKMDPGPLFPWGRLPGNIVKIRTSSVITA